MTNLEYIKTLLADAKKHERHRNNAETTYWLAQYKMIAERAVVMLEATATRDNCQE